MGIDSFIYGIIIENLDKKIIFEHDKLISLHSYISSPSVYLDRDFRCEYCVPFLGYLQYSYCKSDYPIYCSQCGTILRYSLNNIGVRNELNHFKKNPIINTAEQLFRFTNLSTAVQIKNQDIYGIVKANFVNFPWHLVL